MIRSAARPRRGVGRHARLTVAAVVVGAGRGIRLGAGRPKALVSLAGRTMLARSAEAFLSHPRVSRVVAVVPVPAAARRLLGRLAERLVLVRGGAERQDSVRIGLLAAGEVDLVLVHDAARPLVPREVIDRVIEAAARHGAAVPGIVPPDTVKRINRRGRVAATIPRDGLRLAQTPQGFRREILVAAHARAARGRFAGTDDAALVERAGRPVAVVEGSRRNLKITLPEDLAAAEALLSGAGRRRVVAAPGPASLLRIGCGVDVHPLAPGRRLVLGGVPIAHDRGLEGHSDADVLSHAVCDALLGALGLPDLGTRFPDTDERHRDRPSLWFLEEVATEVRRRGYAVVNLDAAVLAEAPRLQPHVEAMRRALAGAIGCPEAAIGLKAKRFEGLGLVGRGEGMMAQAVVLLERRGPGRP